MNEDIDYMTVYIDGVYDERKRWRNRIKKQIKELNDIKLCGGKVTYAIFEDKIKLLKELLKEE